MFLDHRKIKAKDMLVSTRKTIHDAYRMNETACLKNLISSLKTPEMNTEAIIHLAKQLVIETREYKKKQGKINLLLHQYDLSSEEGLSLMCLAEALLRIPDTTTIDKFISDKISTVKWGQHIHRDQDLFVNAASWSLLLTGKVYAPTLETHTSLWQSLKRTISRLGISVIRPMVMQMMKIIGEQFVMGETINKALVRARKLEKIGYQFSYDMLGEAARTKEDAEHYYQSYAKAIKAIGESAQSLDPVHNPGISIKLSALHPRYHYSQRERVLKELPPLLLALAEHAKQYHIGLTIDAEEADSLDLSLDIFREVYLHPSLSGWDGLGLAVQAYQKRAFFVIDWLMALANQGKKRLMVRLVKGAYWDAEIKMAQVQGLVDYPVFTRKTATDVSFLACAKKLLDNTHLFYPQIATHNAYSIAAVIQMAAKKPLAFEFQCLHGMGQPIYDPILQSPDLSYPCRIYAPVGSHKNLLGYLVRRLLENGANSSFVNQLANDTLPIEKIVFDPILYLENHDCQPHPRIPLPIDIYPDRKNSMGLDLSDQAICAQLELDLLAAKTPSQKLQKLNPATDEEMETALKSAHSALNHWGKTSAAHRANILRRAADLLQTAMPDFIALLTQEGGKCIPDCIGEIREAIDYCRYYAKRAEIDLIPQVLPGPTGESNILSLHPRGVMLCISPWNFPLAIFLGQIIAALAAGNTVIAKPAEQTSLTGHQAIQLLHEAGIPRDVLHLVIGKGSKIGAKLISNPKVAGVLFTGGNDTAKTIEQTLSQRPGPIALFVAETGGQNAMIVDSSALLEQAVIDIIQSAFNSAGQRCSALRVLYVQTEIAPALLAMLKGAMQELMIGEPSLLATDIGPVIDANSLIMLQNHYAAMKHEAKLIAQVPLNHPSNGHYFAPCIFELTHLNILKKEIFGPILHVIRYRSNELDQILDDVINTGYGLTLGIHSRIRATIQHIVARMPVGNTYVNRNMIGAVVGVQPFGGERLSGTGPKAGGPHYLTRLCVERSVSTNMTAVLGNTQLVSLLEEEECQNSKVSLM
jgi:RHH-type proline utilization regulon transcriptional repressor/proline dehydrogenase/delta 1-pyrroline-5-carboxylate dehydrogenase